ncbi:MAG: SPOR domain-containing protein [Pseudomonadota bacterium]
MIIEAEYEEVDDGAQAGSEELGLSADDSLPWLEADEEDDDAGGVDTTQVVVVALFLIAILIAAVGTVYFLGQRTSSEVVADGSVIEAPTSPIKERPDDPGGKEFDGTGDVAPVVAEGEQREGVIATDTTNEDAEEDSTDPTPATSGVGVQLAAYSSRARAEQGWREIAARTNALNGLRYRIEQGTVDIGTVYRLQAIAGDIAAANALCAALKADGIDCQVKP